MESGSSSSLPLFNASRRDLLWDAFTANITGCEGVRRGSTFPCLRNASASELLASWSAAAAVFPDLFLFAPVLDGSSGLIPDLPSKLLAAGRFTSNISLLAGTVLDEGTEFIPQQIFSYYDLLNDFTNAISPYPQVFTAQLESDLAPLLLMYLGDPNLGSPFGTGNETFGAGDLYKVTAALFGDLAFQAPRRAWMEAAVKAGVPAYGYIFADQNAAKADPVLGGMYCVVVLGDVCRGVNAISWASQYTMALRCRTCTASRTSGRRARRVGWSLGL